MYIMTAEEILNEIDIRLTEEEQKDLEFRAFQLRAQAWWDELSGNPLPIPSL